MSSNDDILLLHQSAQQKDSLWLHTLTIKLQKLSLNQL